MATLHIELQDGFEHDTVIARVSGTPPVVREDVTTDLRISRADAIVLDVGDGEHEVEVELPGRGVSARLRVDAGGPTYLLVSRVADGLQLRATRDQPYYL